MINKTAIVYGDWVIAGDRDVHFVSPQHLARLYGLKAEECIMVDITRPETLRALPKGLRRYYPRADGKYKD